MARRFSMLRAELFFKPVQLGLELPDLRTEPRSCSTLCAVSRSGLRPKISGKPSLACFFHWLTLQWMNREFSGKLPLGLVFAQGGQGHLRFEFGAVFTSFGSVIFSHLSARFSILRRREFTE